MIVAVIAVLAAITIARRGPQSGTLVAVAMRTPAAGYGLFVEQGSHGCTVRVGPTSDGGAHFGALTIVGLDACTIPGAAFDASGDGFVYGSALFVSHDGGRHWRPQPGDSVALATRGRTVWSVQRACVSSDGCALQVISSDDGGRRWSAPSTAVAAAGPASVVLAGARSGYLLTGDHLYQSTDGGRTLRRRGLGCTGATAALAVAPGGALVAACGGQPGAGREAKAVSVSLDGARTWSTHYPCGQALICRSAISDGYLGSVAATSARTFFLIGPRSPLLVTRDGGASWTAAAVGDGEGVPAETQFFDARHGVVLGRAATTGAIQIWHTANGGRSWTAVTPRP
jgi:photosystem II stability/assembly factor-like uncharacterized protein